MTASTGRVLAFLIVVAGAVVVAAECEECRVAARHFLRQLFRFAF